MGCRDGGGAGVLLHFSRLDVRMVLQMVCLVGRSYTCVVTREV
jgi:hypothetical protein